MLGMASFVLINLVLALSHSAAANSTLQELPSLCLWFVPFQAAVLESTVYTGLSMLSRSPTQWFCSDTIREANPPCHPCMLVLTTRKGFFTNASECVVLLSYCSVALCV